MFGQQQHFDFVTLCGSILAGLLFLIIVGKVFGLICCEQKSSDGYLLSEYQQSVSILWRLSSHIYPFLTVCLFYIKAHFLTLGPVKSVLFFPKCPDFSRNEQNFNQIIGHDILRQRCAPFLLTKSDHSVSDPTIVESHNSHSVNYILPLSHSNIPPPVTSSWTLASLHQVLPRCCSHQPVWTCAFWSCCQGLRRNSGLHTEDWIFTGGCR